MVVETGIASAAVVFLVSLLLGALGIYVGARLIVGTGDFNHAIVTALIGAIVWAVAGAVVGWIPLLGPLLALVAYVAVINFRYPSEWTAAAMIALVAWVTVLIALSALAFLGITGFEAVGVPGTGDAFDAGFA